MRNKTKITVKQEFSIFVIFLMLLIPIESVYSITITNNPEVKQASDRYALIEWLTDQVSSSTVNYGRNDTSMIYSVSTSGLTTNHSVLVYSLANSTAYYFNVSSSNGTDSATSAIATFTTTQTDTIPPFIDADIPEYFGSTDFPMLIRSEPGTEIRVFVNGNLSGAGYGITGNSGMLSLPGIRLRAGSQKVTPNEIIVRAKDPSNNTNEIRKIVNLDSSIPNIVINTPVVLKKASEAVAQSGLQNRTLYWGETTMQISGTTDEPASMSIYVDDKLALAKNLSVVNISGSWQETVLLGKDGSHKMSIDAKDRAGNEFYQEYLVIIDTVPMDSNIENNIDSLNPSYVTYQTVTGKTKPGATVIVLVNNKTSAAAKDYIEGLKNSGLSYPIFDRPIVSKGTGFSGTLSGQLSSIAEKRLYMTTAADDGTFSLDIALDRENVLKSDVNIQTGTTTLKLTANGAWENTVELFAVDSVGRTATSGPKMVYYTTCGEGGFFEISVREPDPGVISEVFLKEGYASFVLTADLTWKGPGSRDKVEFLPYDMPKVGVQTLSQADVLGKFNLTLGPNGLLKRNGIVTYPISVGPNDNTVFAYINLNPTDHDFGKELNAGTLFQPDLQFPLQIDMKYTYEKPGGKRSEPVSQRKCIDVMVKVDPDVSGMGDSIFNPGAFLRTTESVLANLTSAIDKTLKVTKEVQKYTLVACGVGIVLNTFDTFFTKAACQSQGITGGDIRTVLQSRGCSINYNTQGEPSCNCGNNDKLKACCDATLGALKRQKLFVSYACDRIFCPSVPSLPYHSQTYEDLIVSPKGSELATTSNTGLGNAATQCNPAMFGGNCKFEFKRAWDSVVLFGAASDEYKYALVLAGINPETGTAGQVATYLPQVAVNPYSAFAICSQFQDDAPRYVNVGRTGTDGVPLVFKVYRGKDPASGAQKTMVDYGRYVVVSVLKGQGKPVGDIGKMETIKESTYFEPLNVNIKFDASGCCISGDQTCRQVATNFQGQAVSPNARICLPPEVQMQIMSAYNEDYVFNPTSGLIASVTSMCLPAINGYLISYRNLMEQARLCIHEVEATRKSNGKSCSAFLSTVVCDLVAEAINCAGRPLSKLAQSQGYKSDGLISFNPFTAVSQTANTISSTIGGRYGNSATFKSLMGDQGFVRAACMYAFTGDWSLNSINDMILEKGIPPVESTCVITSAKRKMGSVNPINGKASYLYTVGAMVSAGSDIQSLSLDLVCSNDLSCSNYGTASNPRGECDCFSQGSEKIWPAPIKQTSLNRGDVFDELVVIPVQESQVRYDKLRITYTYTDDKGVSQTKVCGTPVPLIEEGVPNSKCKVLPTIGFQCEIRVGDRGTARFLETPTAPKVGEDDKVFTIGDMLTIPMKIQVQSPQGTVIPKFVRMITRNQDKVQIDEKIMPVDEGVNLYTAWPGFRITEAHFTGGIYGETIKVTSFNDPGIVYDKYATSEASDNEFAVVFSKEGSTYKYTCYKVDVSTPGGMKFIEPIFDKKEVEYSSTSSVSCNGVQLRINNPQNAKQGRVIVKGDKLNEYDGTVLFVQYTKPSSGVQQCTSTVSNWEVEVSLLNSEQNIPGVYDPSYSGPAYGSVVYANGKPQTETVAVKAMCKKTPGTQVATDFSVNYFDVSNTTINLGDNITVFYNINAAKPIESFKLKVGSKEFDLDKNAGKAVIAITDPIYVKGKYPVNLKINGAIYGAAYDLEIK